MEEYKKVTVSFTRDQLEKLKEIMTKEQGYTRNSLVREAVDYFGNVTPSEYKQKKDTKKKLSEMTRLLDELRAMLTIEQQKEKLEHMENCQLSLIALSEKDAFIEGFKLGARMATEIFADTQQWG